MLFGSLALALAATTMTTAAAAFASAASTATTPWMQAVINVIWIGWPSSSKLAIRINALNDEQTIQRQIINDFCWPLINSKSINDIVLRDVIVSWLASVNMELLSVIVSALRRPKLQPIDLLLVLISGVRANITGLLA
jgi:hypothetical protein